MQKSPRHFAVVPAAGHSTRMKEPKLVLPVDGQPLILHTLAAWQRSSVDRIVVIVRPDDGELSAVIRGVSPAVELVVPAIPPADMKVSLQLALSHIEQHFAPAPDDAFLVAPADMPRLSAAIIDRLIAQHTADRSNKILVPAIDGRRGHPVLIPWIFSHEVHNLGPGEGLNAVVQRHGPRLVPCEDLAAANEYPFADLDTPEDYRKMIGDEPK